MEHAIQINKLKLLSKATEKYSRIYYGNEFCPHLSLRLDEVKKVIEFCGENNKKLTLVMSYVTEDSMIKISEILEYLVQIQYRCEIIVNDWGLMYYINKKYKEQFDLVLGCLLNRMKKSPVVMNLLGKVNEETKSALETASINLSPTWDILLSNHVGRVEFENPLQNNRIEKNIPFETSLRYPYVFITTARKCMTNYCVQNLEYYDLTQCNHSCEGTCLSLYNKIMQRELYLKGNTLFYRNDILPENLEKQFSRLVCNSLVVMSE